MEKILRSLSVPSFRIFVLSCFLGSWFLAPGSLIADSSSTNYGLVEDRFSGGGGGASSAGYQLAETSVEPFAAGSLTSANYGLAPKVGINAAANIVSIHSVSPSDYSRHFADENASFTVTAVDPDRDTLQYRARQDGAPKAGPQASDTLTWALGSSDLGRHTMSLEVIDPDGAVAKQQAARVYRRPVK